MKMILTQVGDVVLNPKKNEELWDVYREIGRSGKVTELAIDDLKEIWEDYEIDLPFPKLEGEVKIIEVDSKAIKNKPYWFNINEIK